MDTVGRVWSLHFALACLACSTAVRATEFIFDTIYVHDSASLREAQSLQDLCARLLVRFRLVVHPDDTAALEAAVDQMEREDQAYYLTAASVDYGVGHFYWNASTICGHLEHDRHIEGLYLHELISGEVGAAHRRFDDSDWEQVRAYAACAHAAHKRILWSEWAGGSWGWRTFLTQVSAPGSLARRTLSGYRDVFVFLWANNRDGRKAGDRLDMQEAQVDVTALGDPANPRLPQSARNPLRYTFPHGISIQDWYWYESNRGADGQVSPEVMQELPAAMVTDFGEADLARGGRYFQFEAYWSGRADNSSGKYYPGFFQGIRALRENVLGQSNNCPRR